MYIYIHIQEGWWVSLDTFLELNKAPTVNFRGVTSDLKSLIPAALSHFQKWAGYFGMGNSRAEILRFCTMFVNYRQIYYTNLLQKPGTNIDEINDFSSNRCLLG